MSDYTSALLFQEQHRVGSAAGGTEVMGTKIDGGEEMAASVWVDGKHECRNPYPCRWKGSISDRAVCFVYPRWCLYNDDEKQQDEHELGRPMGNDTIRVQLPLFALEG